MVTVFVAGLRGIGGAEDGVVIFFGEFSNFEAEAFLLSLPITVQNDRMNVTDHDGVIFICKSSKLFQAAAES
jgi:hypothetical protein